MNNKILSTASILGFALTGCGTTDTKPMVDRLNASNIPAAIAVPSGNKLAFT